MFLYIFIVQCYVFFFCFFFFFFFFCFIFFFFFFSSRRRHTRCLSDWSSDVCSSDLMPSGYAARHQSVSWISETSPCSSSSMSSVAKSSRRYSTGASDLLSPHRPHASKLMAKCLRFRSEERRVGKEWRDRWQLTLYKH